MGTGGHWGMGKVKVGCGLGRIGEVREVKGPPLIGCGCLVVDLRWVVNALFLLP